MREPKPAGTKFDYHYEMKPVLSFSQESLIMKSVITCRRFMNALH